MTISSKTPGKKNQSWKESKNWGLAGNHHPADKSLSGALVMLWEVYNSFIHPLYFPVISEGLFILLYRCQASDRGNLSTSDGTKKSGVNLSDEELTLKNVSLLTLYGGQFTFSTQLITLNYPVILSHWRSTTVSLETYPLYSLIFSLDIFFAVPGRVK